MISVKADAENCTKQWSLIENRGYRGKSVYTFMMTRESVNTTRTVSSYNTKLGNTWRPTQTHTNAKTHTMFIFHNTVVGVCKQPHAFYIDGLSPMEAKKMMARKSLIGSMHPMTSVVTI